MTYSARPADQLRKWLPPQLSTFSRDWPAEDNCSSKSATSPASAAPSSTRKPSPSPNRTVEPGNTRPAAPCGQWASEFSHAHALPSLSKGVHGSPGRPSFSHLPLRVLSRPSLLLLVLTSGLRLSAGTAKRSRGRPPIPDFHSLEPLGAASVSGEYCVSRCRRGRGEEEGGRQRSGGSAPRTAGPEAGKVGAVPPPSPGPGPAPTGRLHTPRPSAPLLRHRSARNHRCLRPPGARADVLPPGDVSASGVAWLPRRSPVPLLLASLGGTLTPSSRVWSAF